MTDEQVPTHPITTRQLMNSPEFARGLDDVRKGRPFDPCIDDGLWAYERGRLFGRIVPTTMPLRIGGTLNPKAVALCEDAFRRGLIV